MHGSAGLHSAMAIKRQRRRREREAKKRVLDRRLSSKTNSMDSMEHLPQRRTSFHQAESYQVTSIGLLHIGVCFMVLGLFLIGSGLLPDDLLSWKTGGWWNELTMTGIFVTIIGILLIGLNKIVSRKEEQELQEYVRSQLTRSRSGHRLERDVETGCLTTKHHRRHLEKQREDNRNRTDLDLVAVHSPLTKGAPMTVLNGEAHLEKISEEDLERCEMEVKSLELRENLSATTTASVSPGTPSESRELIANDSICHLHEIWRRHRLISVSRRISSLEDWTMIGAMPAVAVRHERRKGQDKRNKRPSQLYIAGHWLPPNSPSPTPSPGTHEDGTDRLPEVYLFGKVSALQVVVGSLLLGAIFLIVGLVQLVPNAADVDHRYFFIGMGVALLAVGFIMTAVRCFIMHCNRNSRIVMEDPQPTLDAVNSIDVIVQRRDTQITNPSELDALINQSKDATDKETSNSDS